MLEASGKRLLAARSGPYTKSNPLYGPDYYVDGIVKVDGFEFAVERSGLAHYSCVNVIKQVIVDGTYRKHYGTLEGRVVLDIGAFIGVTAVSFAADGAKHVWAFEPDWGYYAIALENIRRNKVDNVTLYNVGIGKGTMTLWENFGRVGPIRINAVPLPGILRQVRPDFIKMDCEGCEYGAFEASDLDGVEEIVMEYHRGPGDILPQLEDFDVTVHPLTGDEKVDGVDKGIIHAYRR
jgi:FkbM family methyltransferase